MEWYWIVIIVVTGYLFMGGATANLIVKVAEDDTALVTGIVWPLTLPIVLGYLLIEKFYDKRR